MSRRLMNSTAFGSAATLLEAGPARAYLDPGTGSMMLQALLGGIAGAMVVGRLYWHRLRAFVTSWFPRRSGEGVPSSHVHASSRSDPPDG
jgi:hypothetical protein